MNKAFSYEEYLEQQGELTYTNVGVSMMPLLRQGKDLFTVRRKERSERCKVGDVALYRRPPDKYVLQAIMTGFVRGGKAHTVSDPGYRLYSFVILHTIPVRVTLKKAYLKAGRLLKRVRRRLNGKR